jgi:HEAT repeat protein
MRLPPMRFSVRRMLVAVAVVAIMFGAAKYIQDNQPPYLWERWLVETEASQRQTAAQELGRMGPEALRSVPAFVEALRIDLDAAVRKQAAISLYMVLARNGEDDARGNAVLALIEAQRDRDPAVRAAAAVALWLCLVRTQKSLKC